MRLMTDRDIATSTLRQRLARLLVEWDAELDDGIASGDSSGEGEAIEERSPPPRASSSLALKAKEAEIARLEARLKRYVEAIIELKHSEDEWRRKYNELVAANVDPDATSTELQAPEDLENRIDPVKLIRA